MSFLSLFPLPSGWQSTMSSTTADVFTDLSPMIVWIVAVLIGVLAVGLIIRFFTR